MVRLEVDKPSIYRFKDITIVPTAKDLVDIVLSSTQRKTPTQVHPQFQISRIRSFYMRKVKFCQQTFHDKFSSILTEFPKLDDIHPFYGELCNVLYDRDHYKVALGQINAVRGTIDGIAKDYVRLLKYADSPYKCKMLKRAALGRICTAVKKLEPSMVYLEEVRQHMSRLPSINPHTRTLILTGFPNVGKSSFMNSVTKANVEVQPYAFTTKSLYVGHFDYKYAPWQVIDTPGILDHPLQSRNTIELTAITALAHINAAILYFLDVSEECGFSIDAQIALFSSISVLFKNKPLIIVLNKCDVQKPADLPEEQQAAIQKMAEGFDEVKFVQASCLTSEGVSEARNTACELLLEQRIRAKLTTGRAEQVEHRLYITPVQPSSDRPPVIPPSVVAVKEVVRSGGEKPAITFELEKQLEDKGGGPGVYSVDLKKNYLLKNPQWKYDIYPSLFNGKNVKDFIDPDIDAKLKALEREEELLLQEEEAMRIDDSDWQATQAVLADLHEKVELTRLKNRLRKSRNHVAAPRKKIRLSSLRTKLGEMGADVPERVLSRAVARKGLAAQSKDADMRGGIGSVVPARGFAALYKQAFSKGKMSVAIPDPAKRQTAVKLKGLADKRIARANRAGEADRFIGTKMPRHLYSGKRGVGKTDWR